MQANPNQQLQWNGVTLTKSISHFVNTILLYDSLRNLKYTTYFRKYMT